MKQRKIIFTLVTGLSIVGYGAFVFAVAPIPGQTTQFLPGESLDPTNCVPGDTYCKVQMVVGIGSSVVSGTPNQILYTDADGKVFGDNVFTRDSTTGNTIIGVANGVVASSISILNTGNVLTWDANTTDGIIDQIIQSQTVGGIPMKGTGTSHANTVTGENAFMLNADLSSFGGPAFQSLIGYTDSTARNLVTQATFDSTGSNLMYIDSTVGEDSRVRVQQGDASLIYSATGATEWMATLSNGYFQIRDNTNGNNYLSISPTDGLYSMGDLDGAGNSTQFIVNDTTSQIFGYSAGGQTQFGDLGLFNNKTTFMVDDQGGSVITGQAKIARFGDINNFNNGIKFIVDDTAQNISLAAPTIQLKNQSSGNSTLSLTTANYSATIGDVAGAANHTQFIVDDSSRLVRANTEIFVISDPIVPSSWFGVNTSLHQISFGDLSNVANKTKLLIDDSARSIRFSYNGGGAGKEYRFPTIDGSSNYLLATDGNGQLFWQDPTMVPSDRSLKSNINELSYGLDTLMQLNPVSYTMNSTGKEQIGFIAQEVESLVPELVGEVANGKKGLAYGQMTAVIVKSVQELNLKITDIENFADAQNKTFLDSLIAWLGDAVNGLTRVHVDRELCIGATCINEQELQSFKNWQSGLSEGFGYGYGQ